MNSKRIIIIGSNGQLGRALQAKYPKAKAVDADNLDITNLALVSNYDWSRFDIVINAAAYTNVDGAETDEGRALAWNINAVGVRNLVQVALKNNLIFIHISSDYVFDGSKKQHLETEGFSPLSVYGDTKASGDIAASLNPKHYIIRTSWVIGDGKNFVNTMLELGSKGIEPKVVSDQTGRPTFTSELVLAIDYLLTTKPNYGTYNITNSGDIVSWADLTRAIFATAHYNLKVTDISTAEYSQGKNHVAVRPLNSDLDLTLINSIGFRPRDWHDSLNEYIEKELRK